MRQAGLLTDLLAAEAEAILARMENLREGENWDALFKELPARQVFFQDCTATAQQASLTRNTSLRERRRRLEMGIAMLKREFQSTGTAHPLELEELSEAETSSGEVDLLRLESLLESAFQKLPSQVASENVITAQQRQLAGALKDQSAGLVKFDDWLLAHSGENATHQLKNDRLAHALAELELQLALEGVAAFFEKARAIAVEPSVEQRALLTDSLLIEAEERCHLARERKDARQKLLEAIAGLEPFQSAEAEAWRQRLKSAIENPAPKAVNELVAAAEKWCAAEAAREDATLRRKAVLKALADLGYEVREGMATAWAENGRVVVRKPSDPTYGVELASAPAGTAIQTRVVAFGGPERSSQSAQRDREVEVSWCADFHQMRKLIEADGITPTLVYAKAAGEVPVKVMVSSDHDQRDNRSNPAAPRTRRAE